MEQHGDVDFAGLGRLQDGEDDADEADDEGEEEEDAEDDLEEESLDENSQESDIIRRVLLFPQIAGSYRGSYFSKVGLLITEIAAAPSLPSSFVSLHADYRNRCRS